MYRILGADGKQYGPISADVLRQWIAQGRGHLRRIELVHILAVESLLAGNRGGRTIELPGGAKVSRKRGWLQLHR